MRDAPRRIIGAISGAGVAVAAYWIALRNGYHVLGAVAIGPGLGSGWAARRRSIAWGVAVAVVSVALTIIVEWRFLPFAVDGSFGFFLRHLSDLSSRSRLSIIAAAAIGF